MSHTLPYAVNCSIQFTELPLLERPEAVRAAGFDAVEFWWPFAEAVPDDKELTAFERAIADAGVQLIALNFFAGDMAHGERGILSSPDRRSEFEESVAVAIELGSKLGCHRFNALYGLRDARWAPEDQDDTASQNLLVAAEAVASLEGRVLIEAISGFDNYPVKTLSDVKGVLWRPALAAIASSLEVQLDIYHLLVNGDGMDHILREAANLPIGHVQVADLPGRGEPGSGELDLEAALDHLQSNGYDGWVGLEYVPTGPTVESFGWLPVDRRGQTPGESTRPDGR